MKIGLTSNALLVLEALESGGFDAYVVGGAVRDQLMGKWHGDIDIATSALPNDAASCLKAIGAVILPTGIEHGTITARLDSEAFEVTTFRVDGSYTDSRHPDAVQFTNSIEEDLARRDFTMNAIAYSPTKGLFDPFDGSADISHKSIRCVGEPQRRFNEDALRILRGLRFAAQLEFGIEAETANAIDECAPLLLRISAERIGTEFSGVIQGKAGASVLRDHVRAFEVFIPEIEPLIGLKQRNPLHIYDVWGHTLAALESQASSDLVTRMATFFHDFGKAPDATEESNESPNYPRMARSGRHGDISARMCQEILGRLHFPKTFSAECANIVAAHDRMIENDDYSVATWLGHLTPNTFFKVLDLKRADIAGHGPEAATHVSDMDRLEIRARRLLDEGACIDASGLAVDGRDLLEAGIPRGPVIGETIDWLLDLVLKGECANTRGELLSRAIERFEAAR